MLLQLLLLWLPAIAYCCYPNQTNKDTARCQNQTRDLLGYALLFLSLSLALSSFYSTVYGIFYLHKQQSRPSDPTTTAFNFNTHRQTYRSGSSLTHAPQHDRSRTIQAQEDARGNGGRNGNVILANPLQPFGI